MNVLKQNILALDRPEIRKLVIGWQGQLRERTDNDHVILIAFNINDKIAEYDDIVERCCRAVGVKRVMVTSKSRKTPFVFARQLIFFFAYQYTTMGVVDIGERLGGKDHTTVTHGKERIAERLEFGDPETCRAVSRVTLELFPELN